MSSPSPRLTGVVVHWRNEDLLAELAAAWPRVPFLALRDGADLGHALLAGERELAAGIVSGWRRALRGGEPR